MVYSSSGGKPSGKNPRGARKIELLQRALRIARKAGPPASPEEQALLDELTGEAASALEALESYGPVRLCPEQSRQARSSPPRAEQRRACALAVDRSTREAVAGSGGREMPGYSIEDRYRLIAENSVDVIALLDLSMHCTYASPSLERFTGFAPEEAIDKPLSETLTPESLSLAGSAFAEELAVVGSGGADLKRHRIMELEHYRKDGSTVWGEVRASFVRDESGRPSGILCVTRDITERKQAEQEKAKLEQELLQAQKVEAIGRLAGGVAHDFNNMLTVINSYASFAIEDLDESDPIRDDVLQIKEAGQRATALVRQLLAFSRRQVMEIEVLEPGETIRGLEKMLRRLLGEDIELFIHCCEELGMVRADKAQIEQVIMNLVVNARDAMPRGGRLVLEATNVLLDEAFARRHPGTSPGPFILLSVSDTGAGMSDETRARIFEPFFTTKGEGKGTGLGLATAYGIVRQSGGAIVVKSEAGAGSTFEVYLPRVDEIRHGAASPAPAPEVKGNETVLVVEDEPGVRAIAERSLRNAGYQVLLAANAGEALLYFEQPDRRMDLLLTDVVLPHMSGKQLADRLRDLCPSIRVLYMTGYADETIARHGVADPDVRLISKPFTGLDLTRRVREVLDEPKEP